MYMYIYIHMVFLNFHSEIPTCNQRWRAKSEISMSNAGDAALQKESLHWSKPFVLRVPHHEPQGKRSLSEDPSFLMFQQNCVYNRAQSFPCKRTQTLPMKELQTPPVFFPNQMVFVLCRVIQPKFT